MKKIIFKILVITILFSGLIIAQAQDYYAGISTSNPTFVEDLKNRIRNPYTKISYDQFDETNIANFAAQSDGSGGHYVTCVYSGFIYSYTGTFTWGTMSREHTFAHSWMPTYPSTSGDEYADQHHLFPTHQNNANARRSNHPLGIVTNVTYQFIDGKLGTNSSGEVVYEPRDSHKGDAARALLYMVLRYDDVNGINWDFNWLNNTKLPSLNEAAQDLDLLLAWHQADPPDAWEISRNDYIQSIQQNRNPFVDHPEYVNFINFYDMSYIPQSSTSTTLNFHTSSVSVADNSSTYDITIDISSPSSSQSTNVDLVLTSGNSSDVGNYTTQTINFPAGSSSSQSVTININNGIGNKTFIFKLRNASGGNNVQIGADSTFTLLVTSSDNKNLIISEYSDASGTGNYIYEFVELYNESQSQVDISNYVLRQANSTLSFTFPSSTIVPSHGFVVIARNSSKSAFESFWNTSLASNVVFINSADRMPQINGNEIFLLENNLSVNVDPKTDDEYTAVPITVGNRVYRISTNNTTSDWVIDSWANANPGVKSENQALPVELVNFSVFKSGSGIILEWSTATEVNNYGFEVERTSHTSTSLSVTTWEKIGFVEGHGNSNSPKDYSFIDTKAPNGNLQYRLKQIDFDGSVSYSDVVSVNNSLAKSFKLFAPYPNPFNPTTTIKYSIPSVIARSEATKQSDGSEIASTASRNDGVYVTLKVYDIIGREVATLVNEKQSAGEYEVEFNAKNLPSGIYFSTLRSNGNMQTQKLILLK